GPLAGVRVLDLGVVIAGPFGPCILANLGADVIKVEPLDGDISRPYGLGFVGYNQGKRAIAVDLKRPEGKQAFLDLAREADVVVDNFRPGVRERLGIDFESIRRLNPRIISCSVSGYGLEGPLAEDPGFDPLLQALGGLMDAQGGDDEPVFHQIPVNDTGSGMMAAFGILAALNARERTGLGQEVRTSLASQTVVFQSGELTQYRGRPAPPRGGRDFPGTSALRRFYRCADDWLAVAATKPEHFQSLAVALGHPEWAGRYVAEHALVEAGDGPLATAIAETFEAMERGEAVERLLARGVPCAPAMRPAELFEDPWGMANEHIWNFEHPQFGRMSAVRGFARFSRTPGGWRRRAPLLGEHTVEVFEEWGLGAGRARKLVDAAVMHQA
ncbi:MAG: CaiB/BaiF CoA transferase family protein, partial [Dehalococcoidia bacterium]